MPGKPVTDQQVRVYMTDRLQHSQRVAAARAGFSERTARRIDADPRLPSQRPAPRGRTVPDPLEAVWEPVLLPILARDPAVQAVTLLRHLQTSDPEAFPDDRVRRTLERRVRDWRALNGPERDVIFRQTPEPGRMALSDFTDANELCVTIAGQPLEQRLYHFVLAYSGWEHAAVVLGGESFPALAENLQNALWTLGGVPGEHRTDSLSAAYRNLDAEAAADVTKRYDAFCAHYGMLASRNNPGEAHENGSVEAHNNHLKVALDQALILRGSRDFADLASWRRFVDELVARRNRRRESAVRIEMAALRPLPARRTVEPKVRLRRNRLHRSGRAGHEDRGLPGPPGLLLGALPTDRQAVEPEVRLRRNGSMSTTTGSRPFSERPLSSRTPAVAAAMTAPASTASTIAMSSTPCAASRRRWPVPFTATACSRDRNTPRPGSRCPPPCRVATPAVAWSICCGSPMRRAVRLNWPR